MSDRIDQILEVVEAVRNRYAASPHVSIASLRINAKNMVAYRRGIRPGTVANKYTRELNDIHTIDFDRLLEEWLVNGSGELKVVIRMHHSDKSDLEAIDKFFKINANSAPSVTTEVDFDAPTTKADLDIVTNLLQENDDVLQPTSDPVLLDERVQCLSRRGKIAKPMGNRTPKVTQNPPAKVIERLPAVKAWVLQQANGICELCQQPGPFLLPNEERYLEVHHVKQLSEGGPDIVENVVALCANCHRHLHFGSDARQAKEKLYIQIPRLIRL